MALWVFMSSRLHNASLLNTWCDVICVFEKKKDSVVPRFFQIPFITVDGGNILPMNI